ncbi:MAG: oligosaccharide flippase family protein, partial [Desulfarculus sp.]|nr:oligosaccharide flippase family protein [Desulfarculus sp.]
LGRTFAEVGWYTAAVRITDALGILAGLVAASLLPVMADLHQRQPEELARLHRQGLRLLLLVGLPAATGLLLERQAVVMAVFGPVYVPAAAAFLWLAPSVALVFVNYLQLTTLAALGRQGLGAATTGLALLVNLGLNWWWIPRFGYLGAAAATLATEAVLLLLNAFFLRRVAGLEWPFTAAWRPLIAAAVMALFLVLEPGWGLGLVIPLAMVVYAGAALASRAVQWDELGRVWALLRHRSRPPVEASPEPPSEEA